MPAPSLYLDECVDATLAIALRQRGYTVTTAVGEGIVGVDDDAQIAYAYQHRLMILSHNRRHFYAAHQRGIQHAGIILMPRVVVPTLTLRTAMMLDWIARQGHYYDGRLYRWHELGSLLEQGMRLPGYTEADVREVLGRQP